MNEINHWSGKFGFVCGGILAVATTGCTVYDASSRSSGAYSESSGPADAAYAEIRVESDFYEPLSPYGRWEEVGSYGRCWIPGGVSADWSPYSEGYWQSTDAGWYWVSDEPWGWATYHYGRWDSSPQFGWYWVPQRQWAPAWVSWREGGGYVGWAPLGPSGQGVVAVNRRGAGPGGYVFVEERRFLEPVRRTTIVVNNPVINQTVINTGPGSAVIERASGRKMQAVPVRQLRSKDEAPVVARHPIPTAAREPAAPAPVRPPAGKAAPAREPRPVEQPATTAAKPQPPASKDVRPADEQRRVAPPDAEQRAPQERARPPESNQRQPLPAAVTPRPESKPEARPEARPAARPETKPEARPETKPEARHEAMPEAKRETRPEAKTESRPAAERPAATREAPEQRAGKDDEQKGGKDDKKND